MHPGTTMLALAAATLAAPALAPPALVPAFLIGQAHAQPATVSAFGARCDGVADDSPALAKAATALRDTGQVIQIPGGCRLRLGGAATVWLRGTGLAGEGVHGFNLGQPAEPARGGRQGSTIIVDTDAGPAFTVSNDWSLTGLTFIWPRQTEAAAAANNGQPILFPPLVAVHGNDTAYGWTFRDNVVRNAFDIIDLTAASGAGHGRIAANSLFALRYALRFRQGDGEMFISDNQFTPASGGAAFPLDGKGRPTGHLLAYAAANTEMMRVEGDGTPDRPSSTSVDGSHLSNNAMYLGRHGLHVVGGAYNMGTWTGTTFDQVASAITVEKGGLIAATTVTGGTWLCQHYGDFDATAPCVGVAGGAPGNTLSLLNVTIAVSYGPAVLFADGGAGNLVISGGTIAGVGNTNSGGPYHGIDFDAAEGSLTLSGTVVASSRAAAATAQAAARGVVVRRARTSVLSGVSLWNWAVPVVVDATAGHHAVSGSTSAGTLARGGKPVQGAGAAAVTQAGNNWDTGP